MTRIAIVGACGRMGQRLGHLSLEDDQLDIACALETEGHTDLGTDYLSLLGRKPSGVKVAATLTDTPDVIIDFSTPESTVHWARTAAAHNVAMVIGTTGLTEAELKVVTSASEKVAIVHAPNMSMGVNLLFRLVGQMARALGDGYDIEISETHHRFKKDAPSGTAMGLLKAICEETGKDTDTVARYDRHGRQAERQAGEIGMHALRLGDTVGKHTVYFSTLGETVSIAHDAHSRDTFAQGALHAAKWVASKPSGLYSMQDVLFGQ